MASMLLRDAADDFEDCDAVQSLLEDIDNIRSKSILVYVCLCSSMPNPSFLLFFIAT
jgi:hypothetical protein